MEQKEMLKVTHIPTTQEDIQVGDVFHSSWGATMHMNTYWRVVRKTSKTVTLRELQTVQHCTGFLSGEEYPIDEYVDSENLYDRRRVEVDGKFYSQVTRWLNAKGSMTVKIESYQFARPWDGKPDTYDHCD